MTAARLRPAANVVIDDGASVSAAGGGRGAKDERVGRGTRRQGEGTPAGDGAGLETARPARPVPPRPVESSRHRQQTYGLIAAVALREK